MSLKIIGAGWGRTGTESLKLALEQVGFGKCYHMFELINDPSRFPYWLDLADGRIPDYEKLFSGYQSAVDFPAALYYREFMNQFPDAKVILTVRDASEWYASASSTIFKDFDPMLLFASRRFGFLSDKLKFIAPAREWIFKILYDGLFEGRREDREWMMQKFSSWNEEVKRIVPAGKLLVFNVKEGWEPLCRFLEIPVPEVPFPRANAREKFRKKTRKMMLRK